MDETTVTDMDTAVLAHDSRNEPRAEILVDDEMLVEEISIDGMCGVY